MFPDPFFCHLKPPNELLQRIFPPTAILFDYLHLRYLLQDAPKIPKPDLDSEDLVLC